jgi:hypothetical protein
VRLTNNFRYWPRRKPAHATRLAGRADLRNRERLRLALPHGVSAPRGTDLGRPSRPGLPLGHPHLGLADRRLTFDGLGAVFLGASSSMLRCLGGSRAIMSAPPAAAQFRVATTSPPPVQRGAVRGDGHGKVGRRIHHRLFVRAHGLVQSAGDVDAGLPAADEAWLFDDEAQVLPIALSSQRAPPASELEPSSEGTEPLVLLPR